MDDIASIQAGKREIKQVGFVISEILHLNNNTEVIHFLKLFFDYHVNLVVSLPMFDVHVDCTPFSYGEVLIVTLCEHQSSDCHPLVYVTDFDHLQVSRIQMSRSFLFGQGRY